MHRLLLTGLNHATAPLAIRERLAFSPAQRTEALAAFRRRFPSAEAVLLSTCNRVELYCARPTHERPRPEDIADFLAEFRSVPAADFRDHLYQKSDLDVVKHLFSVGASLDSMVLGETQILGQVRDAYLQAQQTLATGPMLNPLFQRAMAVGKQVMSQTAIADGRLSVASVAVDYARQIFDRFHDKTILSIGAGEMAVLAIQNFKDLSPRRLLICNRDPDKARTLAAAHGGEAVAFESLSEHLAAADIVISSTGSDRPIITRSLFETVLRQRRYRTIFLIDIALPRDIEAGVGNLENVFLYNIDDLQQVVAATQSRRQDAVDAAWKIISSEVQAFAAAQRTRELGPVIERLYTRYHQMAQEELARTLARMPDISDEERSHMEELTRRIVNKLLHDPVQMLRKGDELHGAPSKYLHALDRLFRLSDRPDDVETDREDLT